MTRKEAMADWQRLRETLPNGGKGWDWTPDERQRSVIARICALFNYAFGSGPEPSETWDAPKGDTGEAK